MKKLNERAQKYGNKTSIPPYITSIMDWWEGNRLSDHGGSYGIIRVKLSFFEIYMSYYFKMK